MFLGEIIKKYRKENNLSLRAFASKCGLSYTYISMLEKNIDYRTGKPIAPTLDSVKYISNAMNIPIDDLLKMLDDEQEFKLNEDVLPNNLNVIPILGTVKAGYDWLAEENVVDYVTLKENIPNIKEYYALKITGDSMLPLLSEGDLVIVHDQDDVESGQTAVILINGEEATVKKVVKTNEGIELHSMNPYYPVKKFTYEDMKSIPVKIIGRVKEAKIKGAFE
ncbi:MAG TPA: XRE family transcriptional regulator [Clostridiaceae bacterium]|jgi:repressor LexA|nr:XRE family transcriptional regulator [Clostridiaceae bacterium]